MSLQIVQGDIVKMKTDAIVNAANAALAPGGGVCGAIFEAAGYEKLNVACRKIGRCPTGSAVITPGFHLPASYVIHAVGPVWYGGSHGEEAALRSCYRKSMELAQEHGLHSIAFPLISAGIYGYPQEEALQVAISEIRDFTAQHEMEVYLVLYDRRTYQLAQDVARGMC